MLTDEEQRHMNGRGAPYAVRWQPPRLRASLPPAAPADVPSGPASGSPSASTSPEPAASVSTPAARTAISGDKMRRGSMWLLASGVAAIAAIVSYSHIYDLGRAHGGSGAPARLLPLSVDMLILAGELMLLHEADAKGRRFLLGWVLVWSGILATLAANVTYGYQFGVIGAIIWGWPAYSFILAAAGMVSVVKRGAARNEGGTADGQADRKGDTSGDEQEEPAKPRRRSQQPPSARARAAALLKRQPDLSDDDVMKKLRVSRSTVERARKDLQKENAGHA